MSMRTYQSPKNGSPTDPQPSRKLPDISPKINSVPRRYEEMKMFSMKGLIHQNIIDIGNKIHEDVVKSVEVSKKQTELETESRMRIRASEDREAAIESERIHARIELEKTLKANQEYYEQLMKEKVLEAENRMESRMMQKLQDERERCNLQLKEAVQAERSKWESLLVTRISEYEQEVSAKHKAEVKSLKDAAREELNQTVQHVRQEETTTRKNIEKKLKQQEEESVLANVQRERHHQLSEIEKLNQQHASEYEELENEKQQCEEEMNHYKNELEGKQEQIEQLENALYQVRKSYHDFIELCKALGPGYGDLLVPLNPPDLR